MSEIFAVSVSESLCDLFHELFALLLVAFADQFREVSIGTVLKNDYQVSFLFVGKELSGFEDVGVL